MDKFRHISGIPQSLFRAILARISRPNKLPLQRFAEELTHTALHAHVISRTSSRRRQNAIIMRMGQPT